MDIIPLWSSHYSFGKSILTLDKPEKINESAPISIFSIAKENKLREIFLVESSMSGFVETYLNSQESKIPVRFGLKLTVCEDINDKSDKSFKTESKVIIWLKNSNNKQLNRIWTRAATDGYYYIPRISWKELQSLWDENLSLSIPNYGSFLHNNLLKGYECAPDFGKIKPNIFWNDMSLPFDNLIKSAHINYGQNNNLDIREVHPIYYYNTNCFYAYNVFRAIQNRSVMSKPQMDHFSSSNFSFQKYMEKVNDRK